MFVLRHLIDTQVKQSRKHILAAFVDFEKAFNSVWWDALLYKLLKAGIHGRMFDIIKSMYEETYYSVRCQDGLTAFFKSTTGLRQGCNLSPILFNLFINKKLYRSFNWQANGLTLNISVLQGLLKLNGKAEKDA